MADIQRIGVDEIIRHFHELDVPRSSVNLHHPLASVIVIALPTKGGDLDRGEA